MLHPDDTIAAVSSATGPGLRAVVRLSGPRTRELVGRLFAAADPAADPVAGRRFTAGAVRLSGVRSPLPTDLLFAPAPRTYTGQDTAELHVFGSPPLVERLLADLLAAGARAAGPGEFTLRAFLAGKKDLPQAEAVLAVIDARTDADLRPALEQLAGGVTQPLRRLRDDLLDLLADVEAGLDFVDEDIEFVGQREILSRVAAGLAHLANLARQLDDRGVSGRPVRVALVGDPNAGKSSLFNALAGADAALVSPAAGTTRDYLTRVVDFGGTAVELTDTAGWQSAADAVEEQAQRLGRREAGRADVVVWCQPADQPADPSRVSRLSAAAGVEVLTARTKADLCRGDPPADGVPVSVLAPGGVDTVRAAIGRLVASVARPSLAPSQSRCRGHVSAATLALRRAYEHALNADPPELLALALRESLDQVGQLSGQIYTNDLLDRVFSRFCIGK